MAGDIPTPSDANAKSIHPVYSVTNIQNKIRVLDGVKVTYSSWVKLFKLHARGYRVLDHIDGSDPPVKTAPTYESWAEVDAIVLQWIYGTLSDDLLVRILDADSTAREAWIKLQNIFISNKSSRAATLEHEFTNLSLSACSSLDDYCQKLKDLAEQLGDVDHPVNEARLVLQLVRGLPPEYDMVASFINQSSTSWDNARSMLQLEQHRQNARQNPSHSVLIASRNNQGSPPANQGQFVPVPNQQSDHNQGRETYARQPSRGRGRGRNRGGRNGGNRGGQSGANATQLQPPTGVNYAPWNSPVAYQSWAPPPCPHPTQAAAWPAPWNSRPGSTATVYNTPMANMAAPSVFTNQPGASVNGIDALNPTELGAALNTMSINIPDPNWYMDSGSSSHLTADPGSQEWKGPFPPQ